jgi:hypothetical protein
MSGQNWPSELRSYWNSLDDQWSSTRGRWNDGTTSLFAGLYWEHLEFETKALEPAMQQLLGDLDTARRVAETR